MNDTKVEKALAAYAARLDESWWKDESYKWKAIKTFQDSWDIYANDFPTMLRESLEDTGNLLASQYVFPRGMIQELSDAAPEEVRKLFLNLFNEELEIIDRIEAFSKGAEALRNTYAPEAKNHFQDVSTITTYLWLQFPDKYYIYRYSLANAVVEHMDIGEKIGRGNPRKNFPKFMALYNETRNELQKDPIFADYLSKHADSEHYADPLLTTLTIDFGYFLSKEYEEKGSESSLDSDFELTVDQWVGLLSNPEVFTTSSLELVKRMLDIGGEASCKDLEKAYGEKYNFYVSVTSRLAKRVIQAIGKEEFSDDHKDKLWPVLFDGIKSDKVQTGHFIWKLRPNLKAALEHTDLDHIQLSVKEEPQGPRAWWLTANPKYWSFDSVELGGTDYFTLHNEAGSQRRIFSNFLKLQKDDLIFGYEAGSKRELMCLCRVTAPSDENRFWFEKVEELGSPIPLSRIKNNPELEDMQVLQSPQGSLFKLKPNEEQCLLDLIRSDNPISPVQPSTQPYSREDFLKEVFMSDADYDALSNLLQFKKNVILQGAPGVGKTFAAKRIAYSLMGTRDDSRVELVQFHQNYSYEDFILGYRPDGEGFKLSEGVFYRFCKRAAANPTKPHFFIIDEINRGNLSKIFGELMMLIERDYRNESLTLPYGDREFSIPANVHILGMMNTADRSLALIDYALRRRFSFFTLRPRFDSDGFKALISTSQTPRFAELITKITTLNSEIASDPMLGEGFCIGHSYFCATDKMTEEFLRAIVEFDIIPTLTEYWFDDLDRVNTWAENLRGVLK